jgi:hypothetical protein
MSSALTNPARIPFNTRMNWQLLLPLLVTTVVAVSGWYFVHYLQNLRDIRNKRRELRVAYLIEAYRRLESVCHRPPLGPEDSKGIESAIADIQLLGSPNQVQLAHKFVTEHAANKTADIEGLLSDLRNDLRGELGLEKSPYSTEFLRVTWNESSRMNKKSPGH